MLVLSFELFEKMNSNEEESIYSLKGIAYWICYDYENKSRSYFRTSGAKRSRLQVFCRCYLQLVTCLISETREVYLSLRISPLHGANCCQTLRNCWFPPSFLQGSWYFGPLFRSPTMSLTVWVTAFSFLDSTPKFSFRQLSSLSLLSFPGEKWERVPLYLLYGSLLGLRAVMLPFNLLFPRLVSQPLIV